MTLRVNGGIITDQMLTGHLRYFKIAGDFAPSVSAGTVTLDPTESKVTAPQSYFVVGSAEKPRPVPGSFADLAIRAIQEKCTIVEIGLVGTVGAETEIHISAANTAFGWMDYSDPENVVVDIQGMIDAIAAHGEDTVPDVGAGVDDILAVPVTKAAPTVVTITEVPFVLA